MLEVNAEVQVLQQERVETQEKRDELFSQIRKNHGIPKAMELTVEHDTGLIYELDDPGIVLAIATAEEIRAFQDLPRDQDFVRKLKRAIAKQSGRPQKEGPITFPGKVIPPQK